jgi:hypothetical protein
MSDTPEEADNEWQQGNLRWGDPNLYIALASVIPYRKAGGGYFRGPVGSDDTQLGPKPPRGRLDLRTKGRVIMLEPFLRFLPYSPKCLESSVLGSSYPEPT